MSNLENLLDFYGLAGNKKAAELVEALLDVLSDKAGSEEPPAPPKPKTACVGTYLLDRGDTAVVSYDKRWCGVADEPFVLQGILRNDGDLSGDSWTDRGGYLDDNSVDGYNLVIPEGHVHVHYVVVESAKHKVSYPKSIFSYASLAVAREDNFDNLPILRITYRDDTIISAQLVNDWEVA